MAIYASRPKTDFVPAPEGLHQAVCVDVVDLGEQPTVWGPKHKVKLVWQIAQRMESGLPYLVSCRYTLSLHEKATLCQHLEAWRGRRFSDQELEMFDLEKLVGVNCQLQIIHNTKEDTTYANVQTIVPAKGLTPIRAENYVRERDRTENDNGYKTDDDDFVPF